MIEAKVKKVLGNFHLDAQLKANSPLQITGRNGSGKSTLLRIIAGIMKPDQGSVYLFGQDVTHLPLNRRKTVYVNHSAFLPSMTVDDHLWYASDRTAENREEVLETLGINFRGKVSQLSLGQRMRLSVASAILSKPRALLLDEVLSNISEKREIARGIIDLCKGRNIALVVVDQEQIPGFEDYRRMENGKVLE